MLKTYTLTEGVTVRKANAAVRTAAAHALSLYPSVGASGSRATTQRRRDHGREKYVHGLDSMLRSTLTVAVERDEHGTLLMRVCWPSNYTTWGQADDYTKVRAVIHDDVLLTRDLVDWSKPVRRN